jgi:23S rRNA-/tRNA-specific pseudouridylate synthase
VTPPPFRVVHLDNHLLVVVKPPGLLAQADRTGDADVVSLAKAYLKARFERPGDVFVGLVHRLDRPASGLMALARTSKAAARLTDAFKAREVEKRYLAVVEGALDGAGERTDWIRKVNARIRLVPEGAPEAKEARMRWRALARDGSGPAARTLVEVELLTGRPHQARLQLAALGTPILGDFKHGARTRFADAAVALHAWRLAFAHPVRRAPCAFEAPPPPSWSGLFEREIGALVPAPSARVEGGGAEDGEGPE